MPRVEKIVAADPIAAGVANFAAVGEVELVRAEGEEAGENILAVAHLLPNGIAPIVALRHRITWSNCSGWETGRVLSITESIRLKMAVLAPMPRASDRIATAAKPGLERRARRA